MTQSIIVYRNPMEQAFWEMMMGGELFIFVVAAIVCVVITVIVDSALAKRRIHYVFSIGRGYISLAVGLIVGAVVVWKMWL